MLAFGCRGLCVPPTRQREPCTERQVAAVREFLRNPLKSLPALLGVVSVTIGIIIGILTLVDRLSSSPRRSETSRLIIVDSSQSMRRLFSPQTKFDAAAAEVRKDVGREPNVDHALRFTGGSCDASRGDPAVDFAKNNEDEIRTELDHQRARVGGKANFVDTIVMGLDDFRDFEDAASAKVQSIWLFLGTPFDACYSPERAVKEVRAALSESDAKISHVDFFALGSENISFEKLKSRMESIAGDIFVMRASNVDELSEFVEATKRRETPSP
jgi:hypothetical protein